MRVIPLKTNQRQDFGTPHCRVASAVTEERNGKYRVNVFDMKDVGLENESFTAGYTPLTGARGGDISI